MYRIYADEFLLHDDRLEDYRVMSPKLELEVNKTGSFQFSIYPDHIYYTKITRIKTIITVFQGSTIVFRGRVLNEEKGFYNEKQVSCEGELAFLLDSIQRPYEFTGSVLDYFTQLITNHNEQVEAAKQFVIGNVTVTDPNDYIVRSNIDHVSTWDELNKKLIDNLGGYVQVRHEEGKNIIDYLAEFKTLSTQAVEFGKNLIDLKNITKGENMATALIPLGAKLKDNEGKDTDKRLTVAAVNDGKDFITDADAVDKFGFICRQQIWDDVTEASNLLTKGKAYLASLVNVASSIELTAADLAGIDLNMKTFRLGSQVQVISPLHGINQLFVVKKLSVDLLDPASNKLTLGGMLETFTAMTAGAVSIQGRDGKDGKDGEDGTVLRIDSSRGTVFKNNEVATTLSVVIYRGNKRITNKAAMIEEFGLAAHIEWSWQRMDESTFGVILASDSRIKDDGFSLVLTPDDVDTKATFQCKLIV